MFKPEWVATEISIGFFDRGRRYGSREFGLFGANGNYR
jgi:hypothetical protein